MKVLKNRSHYAVYLLLVLLVSTSCKSGPKSEDKTIEVSMDATEDDLKAVEDLKRAKQIFYSLPSPLETSMILKRAGADFHEDLLNSVDNAVNYNTNRSMALNLGIYSTNLSFCSLFDQTQLTMEYMSASKKMAEGLGILNAIDENTITTLEENINNRDVIMDVVSESFLNSNSFLQENDRSEIAAMIMVGGWIEGLYIASELESRTSNTELKARLIDQKLTMNNLLKLLETHSEIPAVSELMIDMQSLSAVYDKITIESTNVETIVNKEDNKTILDSENKVTVSEEVYKELKTKIKELRNSYIQ